MPRGIGTSSGVKLTRHRCRRRGRERFWVISGVCRWHAADAVRRRRCPSPRCRAGAASRPCRRRWCRRRRPRRRRARRGRRRPPGARAERGDGRVAAGDGDPGGAGQLRALAGQLGQAVGPGAGVAAAVEPLPGRRVGEPEVGAAVDDHDVLAQLGRDRAGLRRAAAPGRRRRGRPGSRRWSPRGPGRRAGPGAAGGCRASRPRWMPAVSAPISTSGWPSSRRSSSPPAYPLAPATATFVLVMLHDYTDDAVCHASRQPGFRNRHRYAGATPVRSALASVATMPRLEYPTYLDHIRTESARFREVLADCDPAARVPACPDWDAADLLWHLAGGAAVLGQGGPAPAGRRRTTEIATSRRRPAAGVLRRAARRLRRLLPRAGHRARAGRPRRAHAWHWSPEQTVGTSYRRQAHEALIHRLDAELTAGVPVTPLDAALAADGVAEALESDVRRRATGVGPRSSASGEHVAVELTDTGADLLGRARHVLRHRPRDGKTYDGRRRHRCSSTTRAGQPTRRSAAPPPTSTPGSGSATRRRRRHRGRRRPDPHRG